MVEAQKWLDENYPENERNKVKELSIVGLTDEDDDDGKGYHKYEDEKLTGSLNLSDFINLEKLDCSCNQLTELILYHCTKLKELNCSVNQLTSLDLTNYIGLKKLVCSWNHLTKLDCSNCQITTLMVEENPLTQINCSNNQLTTLDFVPKHIGMELILLDVSNNKITCDDENYFLDITKSHGRLRELNLSNSPFSISLRPLQHCKNLEKLNISNTQIDSGLEYLPESLEEIYCEGTKLVEELRDYKVETVSYVYYDYRSWRKDHWREAAFVEYPLLKSEIDSLEKENQELKSKLTKQLGNNDYEDDIAIRKERELERKKKMFNVYVEKGNEEKMEKVEEEISRLEEEISNLKLEQKQQQLTQIQVNPK